MPRKPEASLNPATAAALSALDGMWAAVDAARADMDLDVCERPANGITSREYAQRYDVSESTAVYHLGKCVKARRLRIVRAYVPNTAGRNMPTNVYVPVT